MITLCSILSYQAETTNYYFQIEKSINFVDNYSTDVFSLSFYTYFSTDGWKIGRLEGTCSSNHPSFHIY